MSGYKRVLLKLSGEALMGDDAFGINRATIEGMVAQIKAVVDTGVQMAVVIGGGNIFRGMAGGAAGVWLGSVIKTTLLTEPSPSLKRFRVALSAMPP